MTRTTIRSLEPAGWLLLTALAVGAASGIARADDTSLLPVQDSEIPKVLFIVERAESMQDGYFSDATFVSRWEVVVEAIIAAVNSAPTEMEFAVVGTADNVNQWERIASFDDSRTELTTALRNLSAPSESEALLASTYNNVIEDYLSLATPSQSGWNRMPFVEECSVIDVIFIGDGMGDTGDTGATNLIFSGDKYMTAQPEDEVDRTLLDDVAFYAVNNDLNAYWAGSQTVRTHAILVDATSAGTDADELYAAVASAGAGIYTYAANPDDVAVGISHSITDLIRSLTGITVTATSSSGHRIFRNWTEIWGYDNNDRGYPLYRGHFEAFKVINDPADPNYGELSPTSELWDAGQLLASRLEIHASVNSEEYSPSDASADADQYTRTLWTGPEESGSFQPRSLIPFDSTMIGTIGPLLLPYCGFAPYPDCHAIPGNGLRYDFNADQVVNDDDAQLAMDFIRGYPDAEYGNNDGNFAVKGPWKMGGMFLASPAYAPANPPIVTDDPAFYQFMVRIAELDSVAYIPSNSGWLHAFKVPFLDSDDDGWEDGNTDVTGGWELWGYIPRHVVDHESAYHEDMHRARALKLDGEVHINDGSVNLTYVWMDGVPNLLADCGSAQADGERDPSGCEYHRVLVVSMGLGSRYHYALDVTDPWQPRYLWEWVGEDQWGWRKGVSTGTPVIVDVLDNTTEDYRPVVIWSGGTRDNDGYTDDERRVAARWYMVDLLDPSNATFSQDGYAFPPSESIFISNGSVYDADDPASGVFGTPAAVDYDEDGVVDALYVGSRHGYLFKVLIDNGDLDASTMEAASNVCAFHDPPSNPTYPNLHNKDSHAVFFRPSVAFDIDGNLRVTYGTGWPGNLFEAYDEGNVFFVQDPDPWTCSTAQESSCGASYNPMTLNAGEKLVGPVLTMGGIVMFVTYYTADGPCEIGDSRVYALALDDTCAGAYESGQDWGPSGLTATGSEYVTIEDAIPSSFSYSNDGIYLTVTTASGSIDTIGPIRPQPTTAAGDRIFLANWRNVF